MQTEASVEIDRPIEAVFDFTHKNVAVWSTIVVEDETIDEKPEGVGTTFRVVTEDRGQRMEFDGLVTRHDVPNAHSCVMKGKQFDIEADYTFVDLGGRTRVMQRSTVTPKGFLKAVFFLFGWLMKKSSCNALENELHNLKRICEARESPAAS